MKLMISEILQKTHNAKTKAEKIKILQANNTQALRSLFIMNYDDSIKCVIPEGEVPYTPNEAPMGTEHTRLELEAKKLYYFIKGGADHLQQMKRESMFIQMCEGLHKDEAEVLCAVKDKKLGKKYRITKTVVGEAFPEIKWGGRGPQK
jgi:hypothetical protein|tara:strand:- start:5409 stop:5852 length:444 start_codon:yes stop_codon:yes gene_type:complete